MGLKDFAVSFLSGCVWLFSFEGAYAQQTFNPGSICTDSLEFNSAFSADGMSFYFSRSINNKKRILFSQKNGDEWSSPTYATFNAENFSDVDAAFSPSGDLYFISNRPVSTSDTIRDYNIWRVSPLGRDTWTEPKNMISLNSDRDEFYISFTTAGDAYFSSSRHGGFGEEDIYYAKRAKDSFETPVNLGPEINTTHTEYDPFVSANGNVVIFASSGRADSFGKADLYWSTKKEKQWTTAEHLDKSVNTATRDFCPYINAEENLFFFSSDREIKFISIDTLPKELIAVLKRKIH